ncbi:MAG: winged helix-turn-helix transcriptional regulator [Solirubrobacterales bacterium]|nr:winged helix-turn-helix transcriptional regulator [Solirubrobacterales bacterium]
MSQDFIQPNQRSGSGRWVIQEILENAAGSRELFPYGGFQGLDATEVQVLLASATTERTSLEAISVHLRLETSSASKAMAALELKGLITKAVDPSDKRRKFFRSTAKGRAVGRKYLESV